MKITCPKCGRALAPSGSVDAPGMTLPVYQCDECIVSVELFGERHDVALTFCVDENGKPFDPASPDGSLPL